MRAWLASLWARLRWRRRLAPLSLPSGTVMVDLRLVVHRDLAGKLSYLIRDPEGRQADATALSSLFTAVADLGLSIPGINPAVRKACKRLDGAMASLRAQARRSIAREQESRPKGGDRAA